MKNWYSTRQTYQFGGQIAEELDTLLEPLPAWRDPADAAYMKVQARRNGRWQGRGQRGQSLTEFALALPLLALIVFGMIEFGFMLNDQIWVVQAARDGARVAAEDGVGSPNQASDVYTAVNQSNGSVIPSGNCALTSPTEQGAGITPNYNTNSAGSADTVASWTVDVSCSYTPITPLGSLLKYFGGGSSGFTIEQKITMRDLACNQPTCNP